ncbi:hypothetical protein ACQ4PT_065778 [Festuca glaucescens]
MLAHMELDLQQQFEDIKVHGMIVSLESMSETHASMDWYHVSRTLVICKLKEGDPLSLHVIKMVGFVHSLDRLGFPFGKEFATYVILNSLPSSYGPFISNKHMHGMDKKLNELHGMLKTVEADIKKGTSQVLMVQKNSKIKKNSWSKEKAKSKGGNALDSIPSVASVTK